VSRHSLIHIRTPGYWPLPKFVSIYDGAEWQALSPIKLGEKEGEYEGEGPARADRSPPDFFILEAAITKALPKKIHLQIGAQKRRIVLSRWIGGLYSNLRSSASQKEVRSFYDAIASRYKYHVEPGRDKQLLALATALAPLLPKNAKVLDASAGDCTFAKAAKEAGLDFEVFCSDISPEMLELRDKTIVPASRIAVAPASRLPYPASSFDAVVHTYSNIHPSDKKMFRSFLRVLKEGGLLLYHPVKAPGEQWPKKFEEKVGKSMRAAGFATVERRIAHAKGARRQTMLTFYVAGPKGD